MKVVVDRMTRRILERLEQHVPVDHAALAESVGCAEDVVRHRLGQLEEAGLLQAYRLRMVDMPGRPAQEALLLGVPGPTTDAAALQRLGAMPGVLHVFTLASAASLIVHMRGQDAKDVERRAQEAAEAAGLNGHQVVLVIQSMAGTPDIEPEAGPTAAVHEDGPTGAVREEGTIQHVGPRVE